MITREKQTWDDVSRTANFIGQSAVHAQTKDALDRVLNRTGDNSRDGRPYGTDLPGQGHVGNVTTVAVADKPQAHDHTGQGLQ